MDKRLDPDIIAEAAEAWRGGYWCISEEARRGKRHRGRNNHSIRAESADDVLARHGVTLDSDRALYLEYERAVRTAAMLKMAS